jgi:hypothetical protein
MTQHAVRKLSNLGIKHPGAIGRLNVDRRKRR